MMEGDKVTDKYKDTTRARLPGRKRVVCDHTSMPEYTRAIGTGGIKIAIVCGLKKGLSLLKLKDKTRVKKTKR